MICTFCLASRSWRQVRKWRSIQCDNVNVLETLGWKSWIQKTLGRHGSLDEHDEEAMLKSDDAKASEARSENVTPRASTATLTVTVN